MSCSLKGLRDRRNFKGGASSIWGRTSNDAGEPEIGLRIIHALASPADPSGVWIRLLRCGILLLILIRQPGGTSSALPSFSTLLPISFCGRLWNQGGLVGPGGKKNSERMLAPGNTYSKS